MSYDLTALAAHRNELLLAEVAAWLHDMGKCADAFLQPDGTGFRAITCQDNPQVNPHKAIYEPTELTQLPYWSRLSPRRGQCSRLEEAHHSTALWQTITNLGIQPAGLDLSVTIPGVGRTSVRELILWGRPLVSDQFAQFQRVMGSLVFMFSYLGRAHGAAHIEKEESEARSSAFISSPFGFENTRLDDLNSKIEQVLLAATTRFQRDHLIEILRANFDLALGDTRYPENEVTLWDWASLVAALYKPAVAGVLLGHMPQPSNLRWRLLSVRVNSSAFLDHVTRMPDLLARQQLIQNGFDKVRILLEVTYPLGTEVYRDEDSSLYVVPDLPYLMNLTNQPDQQGECLESLIEQSFSQGTVNNDPGLAISGEIVPEVILDDASWWGQRPDRSAPTQDELPPISRVLQQPITANADIDTVAGWWSARRDICPVCGLRPQAAPDTKAGQRQVCNICERRRDDRARAWVANLGTSTIWLDEVADVNGRIVLLIGQFDLSEWIEGELVRTLTVNDPLRTPGGTSGDIGKNPSFSRLRRVWETTHQFWQEVLPTNPSQNLQQSLVVQVIGQGGLRLTLQGTVRPAKEDGTPGPFHAYELRLVNGIGLSVVWDPDRQRFVTIDNLGHIASLLGEQIPTKTKEESFTSYEKRVSSWAADRVGSYLLGELAIEEPSGFGAANIIWDGITVAPDGVGRIIDAQGEEIAYPPIIPILAEPATFMALIPANRALDVVQAIKAKYEREMGKVRNRLPLTLGVVYAGRRQPLASVLDAGRRMLRHRPQTVQAAVEAVSQVTPWPQEVNLRLRVGKQRITITMPTVMGDGITEDVWYPYWQVGGKPTDRRRWFVGPDGEHWVHMCDLRAGDEVGFTPSTFDFEFLDASTRRFEVAYSHDGQRLGKDKHQRPYLLEQVDDLADAWAQISRLPTSQIKALESLIESKRRDWDEPLGTPNVSPAFRLFVADALREAEVHTSLLEEAAVAGMLADTLEIHLTIHKEKPS